MNTWGDDPLLNEKKLEEEAPRNVSSFLRMIRKAEGADYDTLYGGGKFKDFTDHPLESKAIQTQYGTTTSAAGGYQFQRDTWNNLKQRLKLKDFSAENQDIAALELIREAGALEDVQAGRLDEAVRKVSPIWASLPGNKSGQPTRSKEFIQQAFLEQDKSKAGGEEIVTEEIWTPEDPVAMEEGWTPTDPVAKASTWEHIAATPDTMIGMAKQIMGGGLRAIGETDDWTSVSGMVKGSMELGRKAGQHFAGTEGGSSISEMMVKEGAEMFSTGKKEQEAAMPVGETPNDPSTADFWKRMVTLGLANVGMQALPLAAGVITRSPLIPLASAGAMAYAQEYGEQREHGTGIWESRLRSSLIGTGEMVTEFFPAKWLTEMVPGKILKTLGAVLITDFGGEQAQNIIQSVNAKYSTHPDMTFDDYLQSVLDVAGMTVVATPIQGVAAGGLSLALHGKKPEAKPLPPPGGPPAEGVPGADNVPLTDPVTTPNPNIDLDTTVQDSDAISAGIAEIDALDTASIGERELEESRKIVEDFDAAKKAKPIPQADLHWAQLSTAPADVVDIAEMGATSRQAGNAENYVNPNIGDRLDRTFSMATVPAAVGLTPKQILPTPGVYVLGEPTADRPVELLTALMETAEPLRQKYMPDATLVISNEQLYSDSALGWHHLAGQKQHMIVPAVLRKMKDPKAFNVNTQAGVFFNFFHEFSHALFFERLLEGVPGDLSSQMIRESRVGVVSEEAIARIPDPAVQGVIREYNGIKARIMDNTMTAQEFADTWLGPAKRARKYLGELKVDPSDSANAVMRAVVRKTVTESRLTMSEMSKKQMKDKLTQDFFSLEEYFAEQGARNAYRTKQDQMTPLGKFLERGLASLRALFGDLKAALVIAPGVKFAEWMDGLPQVGRLAEEKHHIAKSKQNAGKRSTKPAKKSAPVALKPSGYTPEQNIFNTPELTRNRVFAWRSMGEKEYEKLVAGEKEYVGAKQGTKGNFLAGTPESAGQFGGKSRYLVEFGGVKIAGDEGLSVGSKAGLENVTAVWKHDGTAWIPQAVPTVTPEPKAKTLPKVKRVAHNVLTEQSVVERQKKLRGIISTLVRKGDIQKGDGTHTELMDLLERKQWAEITEILQDIGVKGVKFELGDDESKELKTSVDMRRLLDLVGHKMYQGGLGNTILKETLQNSVDAVMSEAKVHGTGFDGRVDFVVDHQARTITVKDNGKGMTLADVAGKFLTLAAAGKEAGSAGGFGMAKAAFLFGPAKIHLETTHAGTTTTLDATQEDLLGQKDLRKGASVKKTDLPNGTKLIVWLPKEYKSETGEMRPVAMPYGLDTGPMLAPLTVTYDGKTLPIGKNFPLKDYWKPIRVVFDWGTADLYIKTEKATYPKRNVLSVGVPQFEMQHDWNAKVKLTHNILVDVKPKVSASHTLYPFNLQREAFKPKIAETDEKALNKYLEIIAIKEKSMAAKAAFGKIKQMSLVASDATVKVQPKSKEFKGKIEGIQDAFEGQTVGIEKGSLSVNNKVVYKASEKETYSGSMRAPEVDFADTDLALTEDPALPLLHNNTNFDPVRWGQVNGFPDSGTLMAKLGTLVVEFRNLIADAPSLKEHAEQIRKGYAGISLDKEYQGVNLVSPYTAMFLNPLYPGFDIKNAAELVGLFKYALIHEAAHYKARGSQHGDDFVSVEGQLFAEIESLGGLTQFEAGLRQIVDQHFDTLEALRNAFAERSIENTGESIGEALRGATVRPGDVRQAVGEGRRQEGGRDLPTGTVKLDEGIRKDPVNVTEMEGWKEERFKAPAFKAWFGDWEGNAKGASQARVGAWSLGNDNTLVMDTALATPPAVTFMSLARLKGGENTFHASTPRGLNYLDSVLPETEGDQAKVPVVLNIRNPYVVQDPQSEQPTRADLERQGYDGLVYQNDLDGHITYVVFNLDQIKVVPVRSPYDRASGISLETDFDSSSPEGSMAGRFFSGLKNFLGDEAGGLRVAVRSTIEGAGRKTLSIPQVAWLNQWVEPLQYYDAKASEFIRDRQGLVEESDKIVTEWGGLSQRNTNYLNEVLMKEMEGGQHWFKLVPFKKKIPEAVAPVTWYRYEMTQRAIDEYKKLGVDPLDGGKGQAISGLALRVKNDGLNLINEAEWRAAILLQAKYGANPDVVRHAAKRNKKLFDSIRSTPFFYKARFGHLMLIVREQRAVGRGYETVYQQHYTSKVEWLAAYNRAKDKALPHQQVLHREVTDEEYVMLNVPSELLNTLATEFDLAPAQVLKLQEILMPAKQERVLNQFERNRLGVPGYSRDAMRAYAHWTSHFSSQISKLKYRKLLNGAIRDMDSMIELGEQGLPAKAETGSTAPGHELGVATTSKLRNIQRMMREDRDYIMNPPTEWQAARSAVSVSYLFWNIATGAINFFGQVTNLMRATTKYGHLRGEDMYLDAVYNAASVTSLRGLSKLKKNDQLPPKLAAQFERAVKEGATEQSYAYNLAGVANNHIAYRFRTLKPGMVGWRKFIDLGLLSFRFTEIQTRRAGMMMSLTEQNADRTIGSEEQYQNALKETAILQGDYTLHGKIALFRGSRGAFGGTLPLVTVFFTFAQMMLFNTLGGTELGTRRAFKEQIRKGELPSSAKMSGVSWTYGYTARLWIFFMMMAGYLGMPLMENIMDLLGPLWRRLGGMKPLRQELREFVRAVAGEDMAMLLSRGMMGDVFGYDLARKVGLGRAIPGTESIASEVPKSFEGQVGDMALDLAGVPGSMLRFMAGFYYKPWDEAMLRAPGGVGNMWTAYHWSQHGVRGPNDAEMSWRINPETGRREVRPLTGMDLFIKSLGANPTDVSEKREVEYGAYEASQYWLSRRKVYLDQWDKAMVQEDEASKKAVRIGISEFNKMLREGGKEFYALQITPQQLSAREMARRKAQIGTERGVSRGITGPLQREFRRSFERSEERERREEGQ